MNRKPYPIDVSDEEWAFAAPYLTLMRKDALQRDYSLREVFNGLRCFDAHQIRSSYSFLRIVHNAF
jgi:transposase